MSAENIYPAGPYQGCSHYGRRSPIAELENFTTRDAPGRLLRVLQNIPAAIPQPFPLITGYGLNFTTYFLQSFAVVGGRQIVLENLFSAGTFFNCGWQLLLNGQLVADWVNGSPTIPGNFSGLIMHTMIETEFDTLNMVNLDPGFILTMSFQIATGHARMTQMQS
jgi:hypothetical protein